MDDFKISLGTQLDTSTIPKQVLDIQKKLNAINIKVDFNDDTFKKIEEKISQVSSEIKLTSNASDVAKNIQENIDKATRNIKPQVNVGVTIGDDKLATAINNVQKKFDILNERFSKTSFKMDTESVEKFNSALSQMNYKGIQDAELYLKSLTLDFQLLNAQAVSDLPQNAIEHMNSSLAKMPSTITNINTNFSQLKLSSEDLEKSVSGLASEYNKVNNMSIGSDKIKAYNQLKTETQRVTSEINSQLKAQKLQTAIQTQAISVESRKSQLLANHSSYYAKHTKLLKSNKEEAKKIVDAMRNVDESIKRASDGNSLTNLNRKFNELNSTVKELGLSGMSFADKLKEQFKQLTTYFSVGTAIYSVVNAFKSGLSTLKEVDTQLTEISKSSGLAGESLEQIGDSAYKFATQYGLSINTYMEGIVEYARSGYSGELLEQISALSAKAQSAGAMTAEMSQQYLIATASAYDLKENIAELSAILDGQNEINNPMLQFGGLAI